MSLVLQRPSLFHSATIIADTGPTVALTFKNKLYTLQISTYTLILSFAIPESVHQSPLTGFPFDLGVTLETVGCLLAHMVSLV